MNKCLNHDSFDLMMDYDVTNQGNSLITKVTVRIMGKVTSTSSATAISSATGIAMCSETENTKGIEPVETPGNKKGDCR